tara:strand:- start:173 stop:490 length:318 start_codon:yes stop_codon:yes gene_type:complete
MKSSKYKNKDGISLNYDGDDSHKILVREVISEAIKILSTYRIDSKESMSWAINEGIDFLKVNFDIENKNKRSDEWRIQQFNRDRLLEDRVSTIEELEEKIRKMFK